MGNTYEVFGWHEIMAGEYGYECIYAGESKEEAEAAFWGADRDKYGCVKLEWRL